MINEIENPFSVTKATEFSDNEINDYWVNFNTKDEISIETILNPSEFLPKYVIGGKGCGKTHILRYFSFPLQKIRHKNNIEELLKKDKYIGMYSVFHGINSSRFQGKGIGQEAWASVFEYYFELYVIDNLLITLQELITTLNISSKDEEFLVQKILCILKMQVVEVSSINSLNEYFSALRKKIDFQILNSAFNRKLDIEEVKVLFMPGDLIFGIPSIISNSIKVFSEIKFIYILDEYEKFFEWQKVFVNTLVWDKKKPVTFWIGARRYGYTTRNTKSGESMKPGSEYQEVNLDVIIRNNEDIYKKFAEKLYVNRIVKFYEQQGIKLRLKDVTRKFDEKFQKYDEKALIDDIIEKNEKSKNEYKHIRELRSKISKAITDNNALELKNENEIDFVVGELIKGTNCNPLEQKYKLFLFYQLWYSVGKKGTFKNILGDVNNEFDNYKNSKKSKFKDIVDKRKKDLIAQLTKENNIKSREYVGISKYIELSQGNPRTFILILKKTIEYSKIRGEKPLDDNGFISLDSQYLAIYETARWFYEDAELFGEVGRQMYNSLKKLADYFIVNRFCDKPTETTASCFYVKSEDISEEALSNIEIMKLHSVLIEIESGRLEKNSGRKERLFQLNKTLAPFWDLPIVVRGSIFLNKELTEAIFGLDANKNFDKLYNQRKSEVNAPDFLKSNHNKVSETLF